MLRLFFIFLYVGLFTIGGGMVAIPLIQEQIIKYDLLELEKFYTMIAVAQSTPGPIGMNVATFLGYTQFGIVGSLLTTVGFVTPSVLILSNLYKYINKYRMTPLVQSWLLYIKATVVGLISYALFNIIDIVILEDFDINAINYRMFIVFIILAIIYKFLAKYPWIVIIIGGVFGVLFL